MLLVSELTDGQLSDSGRDRLIELVATDDESLAYYIAWTDLHAALHYDLVGGDIDVLAFAGQRSRPNAGGLTPSGWARPTRPLARRLAIGAVALAASVAVLLFSPLGPDGWEPRGETTAATVERFDHPRIQEFRAKAGLPVAVIANAVGAKWNSPVDLRIGSDVSAGSLRLVEGIAQIEFVSGANVVLEGPAEIELLSPMLVRCVSGKLRAHVPNQAIGFVVETPSKRVVDLGTEFAVSVGSMGDEVHVLDGEVRLELKEAKLASVSPRILRLGEAVRTDRAGGTSDVNARPIDFLGRERLAELASRESTNRIEQWREYRRRLIADESVVLNYGFDAGPEWERILPHTGKARVDSLNGAIVGCRWSEGRWPWKRALDFKRTSDRVRLSVPGEYESVTFSCWLRIDGFDRWLSSIFLTDGHERGEPHWQFTETGQILLGVKVGEASSEYLSPSVLRLVDVGRWLHLACVYDGPGRSVTHYLDGKAVASLPIENETKIRFGAAEVGNWVGTGFVDHTVRSLNGRMDELLIFDRPLSGDEISELHHQGQP